MARSGGSRSRASLTSLVLLAALALIAVLLVIYALRSPVTANGGEDPGPAPTWTRGALSQTTAPPTGTPATQLKPAVMFLNGPGGSGFRVQAGSCGGAAARMESTSDGGDSWAGVNFGPVAPSEILDVEVPSDDVVNVVARVGAACDLTMLTSFTGGEFWQAYPARVVEGTYVDPSSPTNISIRGQTIAGPCSDPRAIQARLSQTYVMCDEGLFLLPSPEGAWAQVDGIPMSAFSVDRDSGTIVKARVRASGCVGVDVQFPSGSASTGAVSESCQIEATDIGSSVGIAISGPNIWVWSGGSFRHSADAGVTWERGD